MQGAGVLYNTYWVRFGRGGPPLSRQLRIPGCCLKRRSGWRRQGRPLLSGQRLSRVTAALLPGQGAGGGDAEGHWSLLRQSSGRPWCSARVTCCSTTWAGAAAFACLHCIRNGDYQVQPVYAEDLAAQAVDAGSGRDSFVADAAGPETFTFEELVRLLTLAVGCPRPVGAYAPAAGVRTDPAGRPAAAGCGAGQSRLNQAAP